MYPKILIISETFKSTSGGGITLTNLFRGYPQKKLANAVDAVFIPDIESDEICQNFYSLGQEERKILTVFKFLHKKYFSGKFEYKISEKKIEKQIERKSNIKSKLKEKINPVFDFLGINHILFHYELSDKFKSWIDEFKPDYIYSQLSSIEMMNFTMELKRYTNSKLAVHIMDDWAVTLGNNGLFSLYWSRIVDIKFRKIIKQADVLLSISDGMAEAYQLRYGRYFTPFHNPIDMEIWRKTSEKSYEKNDEKYVILYSGRIGPGVEESLISCADAILNVEKGGFKVEFQIQSTTNNHYILDQLRTYSFVKINPLARYEDLPTIFSKSDIMIMPFDFSERGISFLKFSMPTKASEYMISGTPVILYCDKKLSIHSHAQKNGWAKIVDKEDPGLLSEAIIELIQNVELRKEMGQKARQFAINAFSREKIHDQFVKCFV